MRRQGNALLVTSVMLVAATIAVVAPPAGARAARRPPVVLSADQAPAGLLTVADLASDWLVLPPSDAPARKMCGAPTTAQRAQANGATATASTHLAADQNLGPFVQSEVYGFPNAAKAERFLQQSVRVVIGCRAMQETDTTTGARTSTSFSSLTLPRVGDDDYGFEATIDVVPAKGATMQHSVKDVAFVRQGTAVAMVGLQAADADADGFVVLVRAAHDRLVSALKATARGAPPATTAAPSPTTLAPADPCADAVASLDHGLPAGGPDPVVLIRSHGLASLPAPQAEGAAVIGVTRYDTIDMYLDGTPVADDDAWRAAMTDAGFVIAEATGYENESARYGAEALNFASPEQALGFQRRTLAATCAKGIVDDVATVAELPGALVYRDTERGISPYRASMVVGSSVVHLNICECTGVDDKLALVRKWALAVAQQLA